MEASVCIEQKGTVEVITDRYIRVSIQRDTACGHCHAQSMCALGDESRRSIEVMNTGTEVRIGDAVDVNISRSAGNKAVFLAYFLPFVLLMASLLILQSLGVKEWITGVVSLSILVPYYLVLYFFRNTLKRTFIFSIRKYES